MRIAFLLFSGAIFVSAQAAGPSGISYTCDPSISALPGICNTLNTTIAGLYASNFTNANANIYVQFGTTALGKSFVFEYVLSYADYRNALQSSLTGANDLLAFSASVPATNPINSAYSVEVTTPLLRVLGFTPTVGAQPDGTSCPLPSSGCYDGLITISSAMQASGSLYYRSGSIQFNQYDFFSVVEHETDEILGTMSCLSQCSSGGTTRIAPADLYRYQSNGTRSYAPGNNSSCAFPNAGNACFSIDGIHMLVPYNNVSGQGDLGDWVPSCPNMRVQNEAACPGVGGVDISPTAEIEVLDVVGYTLAGSAPALAVVDKLTSNTATPGSCTIPPQVNNFTTTALNVWLYFSVTGAHAGDTFQAKFVRPDTSIDTTLNSTVSTVGANGSQCFTLSMPVSGSSAVSYPGTWAIRVYWNQSASPLFTLNFTLTPGVCTYSLDNGGEAFAAAGGDGVINVTAPSGCAWNSLGTPSWVTFTGPSPGTGAGSGVASFHVAADSGSARAATLAIAGVNFAIEQEAASLPGLSLIGSMAHLAGKENWTTDFTLVNKSTSSAIARLSLFGDSLDPTGTGPLTLPLLFPQVGATSLLAATFDRTLAANASLIVNTAGPQISPVLVGSAQLAATGAVDGFAIFHQIATTQEAVVPMNTRTASSYLLAFDNTNGLVLGVAVENVSASNAVIPVVIRDENGVVISAPGAGVSLAGNGHKSFVLSDPLTGFPVTASIRGTIEFDTPVGGRISVLGLRFSPPNSALTTIPALANVGAGGGSIAHLASGGDGWQTTFVLVNTGPSSTSATLSFFNDATGLPLSLPLAFPQSGGGTTMTVPAYTTQLAAGATLVIVSNGAPTLLTGSAQLTTPGHVGGFVIFRHNNQEAVVPLESRNAGGYIIAFDNTGGTATGIAVNAVSAQQVNVPVTVRDSTGATIATDTISLSANGHYAFTLGTDKYPAALTIRGTIEFDTPAGAQIGALGIRIPSSAAHTYTTLPALAK